jgi:hypothetical protein
MTAVAHPWLAVLAEADAFVHMGRHFQRGSASPTLQLLFLLVVILVAVGVSALARYLNDRERASFENPKALFAELCRAHQLDRASRHLLWQFARSQQLAQPAQLFVEPDRFQLERLPEKWRKRRSDLMALRERLFGREMTNDSV